MWKVALAFAVGLLALLVWLRPGGEEGPARPAAPGVEGGRSSRRAAEPAEAGGIEGLVRRDGRPVAAWVEVFPVPIDAGNAVATADAGTDGTFAVNGLAPGDYELHARAAGGAAADAAVSIPASDARVSVVIDLRTGGLVLRGRAVFPDGRPFTGLVRCGAWTRADATGRFRIEAGLRPGTHPIVFLRPGAFRLDSRWVCLPAEGETTFLLDPGDRTVTGRVFAASDRSPIAGADVRFRVGGVETRTRTGADGRFEFRTPRDDGGIAVSAEGWCSVHATILAERDEIEIALDPTDDPSGRVVTEAGAPVPGIRVFAADPHANAPIGPETVTDAVGRFRLAGVPVRTRSLFARGRGWVSAGLAEAVLGGFKPLAESRTNGPGPGFGLVVVPAAWIEGRVLDEAGAAVAGATVTASPRGKGGRVLPARQQELGAGTGVTDGAGRFRIDDLPPGVSYDVVATARGFLERACPTDSLRAGEPAEVEIRLTIGRYLRVRALDAGTGAPIGGATITARFEHVLGERTATGASALSGADGRARIGPLYPGTVSVSGSHPDYSGTGPGVDVPAGSDTEAVLRFAPGLAIAGRVLLPDGSPAPCGWIITSPEEAGEGRGGPFRIPIAEGGRFRLSRLTVGRYLVAAHAEAGGRRFGAEAAVEAGREDLVIRVAPLSGVERRTRFLARVLGPDGSPVARAAIRATTSCDGDVSTWGLIVELGDVRMDLEPSTREIWIEIFDARSLSGLPLACPSGRFGPFTAADSPVEVRLDAATSISGRVVGPDGCGRPEVTVAAMPAWPVDGFGTAHSVATTNREGRFRIDRLGAGDYRLVVNTRDLGSTEALTRGGAEDVVLRLGAVSARIRILDASGAPVAGAEAWAVTETYTTEGPESRRAAGGAAGPDGIVVFRNLDSSLRYELEIHGVLRSGDVSTTRIPAWSPADVDLVLPEPLEIAGVVRDPAGGPAAGAEVWGQGADRQWRSASTDEDGAFDFGPCFPAGPVLLVAQEGETWPPPDASDSRVTIANAGRRDVRLVLSPETRLRIRVENLPADGACQGRIANPEGDWSRELDDSEDGTFSIGALDPEERYTVSFFSWMPGRALGCYRTGLRPGSDEIVVKLAPLGTVRGRLELAGSVYGASVWLDGPAIRCPGTVYPDGRFEIPQVPPGRFTVHAAVRLEQGWVRASAGAAVGVDVRLSFR